MLRILFFLLLMFTSASHANDLLRDPTKPPSQSGVVLSSSMLKQGLRLNSILVSEERRVAVINQQMLAVDESIEGAKVISIEKHRVTLVRKGQSFVLALYPAIAAEEMTKTTKDHS